MTKCKEKPHDYDYEYGDYGDICDDESGYVTTYWDCGKFYDYINDIDYIIEGPKNIRQFIQEGGDVDMEKILRSGDLETAERVLSNGYEIKTGLSWFDDNERHDIWATVSNLDMFKLFVDHLCGKDIKDAFKEIMDRRSPELLPEHINYFIERIKSCHHLFTDIIESDDFDVVEYERKFEEIHGDEAGIVVFPSLFPTNTNVVFYEKLLMEKKLDVDGALGCIVKCIHNKHFKFTLKCDVSHLIRLAKLCLDLGANTSAYFEVIDYDGFYEGEGVGCEGYQRDDIYHIKVSMDEIASINMKHKRKNKFECIELGALCEVIEYMSKFPIHVIQRAFRVYRSKKVTNTLRSLPENLFCSEFGQVRKKMLGIDDSKFGIN